VDKRQGCVDRHAHHAVNGNGAYDSMDATFNEIGYLADAQQNEPVGVFRDKWFGKLYEPRWFLLCRQSII
jgi:hypothetical protein